MKISRANYIRQRLDDPALAEAFGLEWDEQYAAWQATLPADTEQVRAYLASRGLSREQYEQAGTREEVEAAAAAWASEQEAARAAEEARRAREEAARLEEEAAARAVEEAALAEKRAALEADQALVEAALEKGAEMTPEVAGAVLRIAAAGAQRLRA